MANPIKIMIDAAEASGPLQSIALMAAFMVAVLYCVALATEWFDARRKRMTERKREQGGKFETIHERKRCPFETHYTAEAERRAHNLR